MRSLKAVLVSSILSIVVVLCLAGSAMAAITSAQSNFSVDPTDPSKVLVYSSFSQDPAGGTVNVSNFIMPRWDATCSQAGYPELATGGHPNGVYDGPDDSSFTSNIYELQSNFTLNPQSAETCIGTVAYTNDEVVVDAHPGFYREPFIEYSGDSATNSSLTFDLDLTPNSLASSYHLSYFKPNKTTNCNSPDPDDLLAGVQDTPTVEVTDDLKQNHAVSATITGLTRETEYCVTWRASNVAGNAYSVFWGFTTKADPPQIENTSFASEVGGFNFGLDITPGITTSDTALSIQYFEKTGDSCTVPSGGPASHDVFYDDGGVGLRGFSPIHIADSVTGLSPGVPYCVRPYAYNADGEDNSAEYETVTTVAKTAASIDDPGITKTNDPDFPVALIATFNDHGAYDDTGNSSNYSYDIFENTPDRCNATDYFGGQNTVGGSGGFQGSDSFSVPLADFTPGQAYCVAFHIDSAWGDSFDTDLYFAFYGGTAAVVSQVTASADHDTINLIGTIDPGYLETGWGALSFALDGTETCDDLVHVNSPVYDYADTLGQGTVGTVGVSFPLGGMIPNAHYCVKLVAENLMGGDESNWIPVDTGDALDTSPPSAPTGLSSANITKTSAELHWLASTDDVGVTGYKIYKNDGAAGTSSALTKNVDLICGETSHFRVTAVDAQGNESDPSDQFDITGAACAVTPPPGGGTITPPATKLCFDPVKSQSAKGKIGKKKYSVKLSGTIASDGQSVVITTKSSGTTLSFKVDGAKVKATKGSITIKDNPSLVTVSFKVGKKTKSLKVQITRAIC